MNNQSLIVIAALVGVSIMNGNAVLAQEAASQAPSAEDIKLFRKGLRSVKKQLIAANMDLTDTEAEQFWPIYDRYSAELVTITDKKYALFQDYVDNYTTMSGEQAESYMKDRATVEESVLQLRLKYVPIFRKVLSGKATALFFQIDWRLDLITDLQLASVTPLIEPQSMGHSSGVRVEKEQ